MTPETLSAADWLVEAPADATGLPDPPTARAQMRSTAMHAPTPMPRDRADIRFSQSPRPPTSETAV